MMGDSKRQNNKSIQDLIVDKACVKQDVFGTTKAVFSELKEVLAAMTDELGKFAATSDERIEVGLSSNSEYEAQMTLAGDTLLFHMHTNVFTFPPGHMIHRSPYVMSEPKNAYCGVINMYNFLTDSFRFQRLNDTGYLIGRIFVNRDRHFFVEGKQQLGYFYNDFTNGVFGKDQMKEVVETAIKYMINFELYTPPYGAVNQIRMTDVQAISQGMRLQTAKRLGFRFERDEDQSVDF